MFTGLPHFLNPSKGFPCLGYSLVDGLSPAGQLQRAYGTKLEMISYLNVKESVWRELMLCGGVKPALSSVKSPGPLWGIPGC